MITLVALISGASGASAAEQAPDPVADPLGRDTPRGAMIGFLDAIDRGDGERAAEYLDLRNLPSSVKNVAPEKLAVGLSIVLQRSMWVDVQQLSDSQGGMEADDLPSYRDEIGEVPVKNGSIQLLLQRVPDGDGGSVWKVSNATMASILELYDEYRYDPWIEWLYDNVPNVSFLGVELFKWIATLAVVAVATPVVLLIAWWLARTLIKPSSPMHIRMRRLLMGPVSLLVLNTSAGAVLASLGMGVEATRINDTRTVSVALGIWILWSGINLGRDAYRGFLIRRGREAGLALLDPFASALKMVFAVFGVLMWLDNIGFQITALLTGLGIGGVAVALVLQKPLEDVFGAITLFTQQPIKIGDFGRFGDRTGTVEEISLRTTRIRTLDNTVIAVPNMKLASEPIENYSARHKILYAPEILLRNDTTSEQIEQVLDETRALLDRDPLVLKEGARARFSGIGGEALRLSVFAYIDVKDFPSFLAAAEVLNYGVLRIIENNAAKLAHPLMDAILAGSTE